MIKTIHIDDSGDRAKAFLNFIKTLDFVTVEEEIPQWQKEVVLNRIKNTKKEDYLTWDEMEKKIKFD